ncbi:hypothetical protein [Deinococcus sp.]|uniref:hypothetical protein n=1 Tax=Deinococcus sp. TaxID=47478 RepID=UPI003B595FC9
MKYLLALLASSLLNSCRADSGEAMLKTYTRPELLDYLTVAFKESEGYKRVECDGFGGKNAVKACFVTNNPPLEIDSLLKEFEDSGLELLQNWMTTGASTDKVYSYNGEHNYLVGVAFVKTENPINKRYQNQNLSEVMTIYVDKGY